MAQYVVTLRFIEKSLAETHYLKVGKVSLTYTVAAKSKSMALDLAQSKSMDNELLSEGDWVLVEYVVTRI